MVQFPPKLVVGVPRTLLIVIHGVLRAWNSLVSERAHKHAVSLNPS